MDLLKATEIHKADLYYPVWHVVRRAQSSCLLDKVVRTLHAVRDWVTRARFCRGHVADAANRTSPTITSLRPGRPTRLREFVEKAFAHIGRTIDWRGSGADEKGLDKSSGKSQSRRTIDQRSSGEGSRATSTGMQIGTHAVPPRIARMSGRSRARGRRPIFSSVRYARPQALVVCHGQEILGLAVGRVHGAIGEPGIGQVLLDLVSIRSELYAAFADCGILAALTSPHFC